MESDPNFPVVLDTNILLDLYVFNDPTIFTLRSAIERSNVCWLATIPMREELERVLNYPQIAKGLRHHAIDAATVLAHFDAHAHAVPVAARAAVTCKDPDDQKFIDLAVAHRACLLSKDHAVLCMKKRLAKLGVVAQAAIQWDSGLGADQFTTLGATAGKTISKQVPWHGLERTLN